jgi:hypothetical protein
VLTAITVPAMDTATAATDMATVLVTDTVPIMGRLTGRVMRIMADLMVGLIGGTAIRLAVTGKPLSFLKDNSSAKEKPGGDSGLF